MKRNAPRRRTVNNRETFDLRQHSVGVLAAILYALAIILVSAILALGASLFFASIAQGAEAPNAITPSNQMIDQAKQLDGQTIVYEGEAIGEALERGRFAFVNTNDGKNAIGIWMRREDSDRISFFGDYGHTGDRIRVTGEFRRACPEHGGDLDVHSTRVEIMSEGALRSHPVSPGKIVAAAIALLSLGATGLLYQRRRNSKEKAPTIG